MQLFAQNKYEVAIDLLSIKKDKVNVEVKVPSVKQNSVVFCFPAIIPGTYAKYDFGRFIDKLKAFDSDGKKLKVKRKSLNEFEIENAEKLSVVKYKVNDTWDANSKDNYVFQPTGTNIEKGKNVVLSHHGFVGYIDGHSNLPFEITVKKPANFFANTSLKTKIIDNNTVVEYVDNYVKLVDAPTLFCKADTCSFMCNTSRIHIGLYSSSGIVKAESIKSCITPMAKALADFFGVLPVKDYYFILYFSGANDKKVEGNGAAGALEHNYCSMYFLPELADTVALYGFVKDVTAHEFLHILTPLNVHSEEIENFNFLNPILSKHLWMYEGVTEYFAQLVQVRSGLISEKKFMENIHSKIENANAFPIFSFTEMSKNVCTEQYKEDYDDVYQRGALMAFLLDIKLNLLSNNKFGLFDLMMSLSKKFGPDKPFKDDELFELITQLTHPEIRNYFKDFVEGVKPLPYAEYLSKIGWTFQDSIQDTVNSFGRFGIASIGNEGKFKITKTEEERNLFAFKNKDQIVSINNKNIGSEDWHLLEKIFKPEDEQTVSVDVLRSGKKLTLTAKPHKREVLKRNNIKLNKEFSPSQNEIRKKILNN